MHCPVWLRMKIKMRKTSQWMVVILILLPHFSYGDCQRVFGQDGKNLSTPKLMKRDASEASQKSTALKLTAEQLHQWKWTHEPLELLAVRKQDSFVTCMATIPNEKNIILAGREVTMWSTQKSQPEHVFDWTWIPNTYMIAIAVSPDGKWFVTADVLGKLYRWELASRKLTAVKNIEVYDIADLAISPDSSEIAIPPGISFVEFELGDRCAFVAVTWMKSIDLKSFYDRELTKQGWVALSSSGSSPYVDYYRQTYIHGQRDLTLTFRPHVGDKSVVFAWGGHNSGQLTQLMFEGSAQEIKSTVDKYMSFVSWLAHQEFKPDYDSIDRYETEMRAILASRP
jgi:WD40 repeat protein